MDELHKFNKIKYQVNCASEGTGELPEVYITYRHSPFFGKRGIVTAYQNNMLICVSIVMEQDIAHEHDNELFWKNHQVINWWFLPPHIKIVEK